MSQRAITQLFVERVNPPKAGRVEYFDTHQPGLCLRVSASGAKSWAVMYRVEGRKVRETLGTLRDIPRVDEARRRALASMEAARKGVDPVAERRAAASRAAANTVKAAVERYLDRCDKGMSASGKRPLRASTARGYRQLFEHDVLRVQIDGDGQKTYGKGSWAERPLSEITKADVLLLLNEKASRRDRKRRGAAGGAVVQANRLLTRLRTFFGWAVASDLTATDPTVGVLAPGAEQTRDRVLGDDELRLFWAATGALDARRKDAVAWGALCRLLLLTAQRESEVAGLRDSEVVDGEWTIPGERTKNGHPHVVHLSALAAEVFASIPRKEVETKTGRQKVDLLFSGTGETAASGFSRAKAKLDATMLELLRKRDGEAAVLRLWTLHDIRRTATTTMARLGVEEHVADRVLNHVSGKISGVKKIYNRFEYLTEREIALEALWRFIELLVRGDVPPAVAQARVRLWLREETDRRDREAAGNVVDLAQVGATVNGKSGGDVMPIGKAS